MYGIICGTSSIKRMSAIFLIGFCLLCAKCKRSNLRDKSFLVYKNCEFNKENNCSYDTLFFKKLNQNQYRLEFDKDSVFYLKHSDLAIYICDSIYKDCTKTHLLKDTVAMKIQSGNRKHYSYYSLSDSRLVGIKKVHIDDGFFKIYKFKENELQSSHDIKYSYFIDNIGFIAYIDYFDKKYSVLKKVKHNENSVLDENELQILIHSLVSDSVFFEYPKYFPPPPVPLTED